MQTFSESYLPAALKATSGITLTTKVIPLNVDILTKLIQKNKLLHLQKKKKDFTNKVMGSVLYVQNTTKFIFFCFFLRIYIFSDSPIRSFSKHSSEASQHVSFR